MIIEYVRELLDKDGRVLDILSITFYRNSKGTKEQLLGVRIGDTITSSLLASSSEDEISKREVLSALRLGSERSKRYLKQKIAQMEPDSQNSDEN